MASALKVIGIGFWLFCVVSCCLFLYNDYMAETESQGPKAGASKSSACPMGYDVKDGDPPPNHPPIIGQAAATAKRDEGGGTCPLGFGGEDGKKPPVNPPIPEQTKRRQRPAAISCSCADARVRQGSCSGESPSDEVRRPRREQQSCCSAWMLCCRGPLKI